MKTKISNLALINVEELNKLIEFEKDFIEKFKRVDNKAAWDYHRGKLTVLNEIKQSLILASKLAEQAFDAGLERGYSGYPNTDNFTKPNKEEFLNLEIQL